MGQLFEFIILKFKAIYLLVRKLSINLDFIMIVKIKAIILDFIIILKIKAIILDFIMVLKIKAIILDFIIILKIKTIILDFIIILKIKTINRLVRKLSINLNFIKQAFKKYAFFYTQNLTWKSISMISVIHMIDSLIYFKIDFIILKKHLIEITEHVNNFTEDLIKVREQFIYFKLLVKIIIDRIQIDYQKYAIFQVLESMLHFNILLNSRTIIIPFT